VVGEGAADASKERERNCRKDDGCSGMKEDEGKNKSGGVPGKGESRSNARTIVNTQRENAEADGFEEKANIEPVLRGGHVGHAKGIETEAGQDKSEPEGLVDSGLGLAEKGDIRSDPLFEEAHRQVRGVEHKPEDLGRAFPTTEKFVW
jgi:hypothetical protein